MDTNNTTALTTANNAPSTFVKQPEPFTPADTNAPVETSFAPEKEQAPVAATSSEKKQEETAKPKKRRNVEHCKIDHTKDCIVITKDFAKRANNPENAECKKLKELRKEFPSYSVALHEGKKHPNRPSMKGLTEEFMERHIRILHSEDMNEYKHQKKISEAFNCPHMYMRNWFDKKYPDWREYKLQENEAKESA